VSMNPGPSGSFTVQVLGGGGELLENFANLSVSPADPRYVVALVNGGSRIVTFANPALPPDAAIPPPAKPHATPAAGVKLAGGLDGPILAPGDVNFETALGAGKAAAGNSLFGVGLLNLADSFNLLCVPGETDETTIQQLQQYCAGKRAFLIVDCPQTITRDALYSGRLGTAVGGGTPGSLAGENAGNSAYYYPWVVAPDPLAADRPALFPPSGFVAGIYASADSNRSVWKAPAGIAARLAGATGLQANLTELESGDLESRAINCLRRFEVYGDVVWGARTLAGSDQDLSQWKYVPVRRLALFIESSLYAGTKWVVFEPNGEALWARLASDVGSFMQALFLQGAFQGTTPKEAYFVKCDSEINTQVDVDNGTVNITVGFAPLKPAEFVIIQIAQMAAQSQS
jgi:uncharacterized protein